MQCAGACWGLTLTKGGSGVGGAGEGLNMVRKLVFKGGRGMLKEGPGSGWGEGFYRLPRGWLPCPTVACLTELGDPS